LALIFLVIAIVSFSNHTPYISRENIELSQANVSQSQIASSSNQENYPSQQISAERKPASSGTGEKVIIKQTTVQPKTLIDTYITDGPEEGEAIEETTRVTFEFDGLVIYGNKDENIYFETFIEGFDNKWIPASLNSRTVELPAGPHQYTFLVRAMTKNGIDYTPARRTFKINVSPYFGKVKISSVSSGNSAASSMIILRTNLSKDEKIDITGWKIVGKGGIFAIPKGAERYYSFPGLPALQDILVKQGDIINISGSSNPLGQGINFRVNKCMGYLSYKKSFPVPISGSCPKPSQKEISHLSPCCQQFIMRSVNCGLPDYSQKIDIIYDQECSSYLEEHFNYNACFLEYSNDKDFLGNRWYLFMNKNIAVNNNCDTMKLYDSQGMMVSQFSYGYPVCN